MKAITHTQAVIRWRMALSRTIVVGAATAAFFLTSFTEAQADKGNKAEFGMGVSARQIQLTRGVAEIFSEAAPAGTRTQGYSVEFARRGKELEFVLGFGYDNLEASNGYYLETAGDPSIPGHVDFTKFDGFHWYSIDATFVGYLALHRILAIRYGAGLGVGIIRGQITRTDSICSSDNIQRDCVPDPDGAQQNEAIDLPPVLPVFHTHVGLQFRPIKGMAINVDAGLRTVPYFGVSAMFYLW